MQGWNDSFEKSKGEWNMANPQKSKFYDFHHEPNTICKPRTQLKIQNLKQPYQLKPKRIFQINSIDDIAMSSDRLEMDQDFNSQSVSK